MHHKRALTWSCRPHSRMVVHLYVHWNWRYGMSKTEVSHIPPHNNNKHNCNCRLLMTAAVATGSHANCTGQALEICQWMMQFGLKMRVTHFWMNSRFLVYCHYVPGRFCVHISGCIVLFSKPYDDDDGGHPHRWQSGCLDGMVQGRTSEGHGTYA